MKYVLAILCSVHLMSTVRGVSQCIKATECNQVFSRQASRTGIDEGTFCWYIRQKIDCLENVKGACTPKQNEWVQNDIDTAKDKYPQCDSASFVNCSFLGCICLALLAVFFQR
ncbi:uncharacterized protein LOC124111881 [Haliotis rufescens]|uniref:uncharacterized protein LOC124111881 n=1 Tax=Haliotis rufescens TaxID=6454 RepID=UPI001EB032E3|nr:uncharacterized protein LOC124111881 [Haliotis rufescens]